LRVDHERPASRVADNDTVVDGKRVSRQTGDVPASYLHRVAERGVQRKVVRARYTLRFHLHTAVSFKLFFLLVLFLVF